MQLYQTKPKTSLAQTYYELDRKIKELTAKKDSIKKELNALLDTCQESFFIDGEHRVQRETCSRTILDTVKVREILGKKVSQVEKTTTYETLKVFQC